MKIQRTMMTAGLTVAAMFAGPAGAFAVEAFPSENPSLNRKVRNLGMGNVGAGIRGTHDSAPFYNPAGLNDLEDGRFQFTGFTFEAAADSIGLITDVKDLIDDVDTAPNPAARTRVLDTFVQEHTGEFNFLRFSMDLFNYAGPNLAAGVLFDERLQLSFRDRVPGEFDVRNLGDIGMYVAGGYGFWNKLLQVGVTLRPTIRFSMDRIDERIDATDVLGEDASGDPLIQGQFENVKDPRFALAVDLGLKSDLALPVWKNTRLFKLLKPMVGVTWQDVGDTGFSGAPGNDQSVSLGVAVHPDFGKFKNTIGLDIRGLNQEKDFLTKLHIGAESVFDWAVQFGLRAGLNQGYFAVGGTVDFRFVKLDAAYYMEEVGVVSRQDGSARVAATLSFNI